MLHKSSDELLLGWIPVQSRGWQGTFIY